MGCTSSKNVEIKSNMYPRPQQQYSPPNDNAHLVALTSSSYGFLSLDSQKKAAEDSKDADDPLNQMYQKMLNLDAPGSQVPQSWSEVSTVLSQLKTEAQHKSTRPAVTGFFEPETIDISELLDNDEEVSTKNAVQQVSEKPKPKPAKKREASVIHTLEEVDKLADSNSAEEVDSDSDNPSYEVPSFYNSPPKRVARGAESAKPDKRYSMSVVRRPTSINEKQSNKPSKSLSYERKLNQNQENGRHQQPPGSTLFDAEFLESFKEAFEQLSTGVPSTKSQPRKPTAKGNKISQADQQVPTKIPKPNSEEQRRFPVGKVASVKQQGVQSEPRNVQQKTKGNELPAKTMQNKGVFNEADESLKNSKVANLQKAPPSDNEASDRESNSVKSKVAKWQKTQAPPPKENAPVKKIPAKKSQPPPDPLLQFAKKCPPGGEQKVVLYSTSLRGIRKTFEACNTVRNILQSFNVELDERDVSMDSEFRQQLKDLMDKPVPVPRLFIKGRYIGGADEVLQVHESGTLSKLLEGIPCGNLSKDCDGCGGVRFIPCTDCSGSCKAVGQDGTVIRCPECNENGLMRCPICS